jgi:hypothetical protein
MNKNDKHQLPVLRDFIWSKAASSCLAFCYPQQGKPFVLKGREDLVNKFLELNGQPLVAHYRVYKKQKVNLHKFRVYGLLPGYSVRLFSPTRINPYTGKKEKHQRCWIVTFRNETVIAIKPVRYIPRKWLKDLNLYAAKKASPIPLIPYTPSNMKPVVQPPPHAPEPTEEEKQMAAAIAKSNSLMDSVLKEFGAFPGDDPINVYEIDLATLEAMEK